MTDQAQQLYPGDSATAEQLFLLAEEYHRAAEALVAIRRRGKPLSRAPYHMAAIHAIELYLNSLLMFEGMKPCQLRAFRHDLSARIDHELAAGLALRVRTVAHLTKLSEGREYLISRYGTDQIKMVSQINRLEATLEDVRSKVAKRTGKISATTKTLARAELHQT